MYIAVRQYKMKAGSQDELTRRIQEHFVPLIRQTQGFVAYYGVVPGPESFYTVSIFQDQVGAEESNRKAADWVQHNIAEFVQLPPELLAGEVKWSAQPLSSQVHA